MVEVRGLFAHPKGFTSCLRMVGHSQVDKEWQLKEVSIACDTAEERTQVQGPVPQRQSLTCLSVCHGQDMLMSLFPLFP